jgi:glycosyltransferase involved in cell wall biosynthesis
MQTARSEILFIGSGPYSLERRDENDKFEYFSKYYSCNLLTPVNPTTQKRTMLKEITVKDDFILTPFSYYYKSSIVRNLLYIYNVTSKALKIFYIKKRKFKVVITNTPLLSGLCAIIISKFTGAKSIIEVNGNFEAAFKFGRLGKTEAGTLDKVKEKISYYLIRYTTKRADMIKLLYEKQLDFLKKKKEYDKINFVVFPNFTSIEPFIINPKKKNKKYILLVGFPWFLKGVDILIKAFNKISKQFPEYKLKIVGYCPEGKDFYENLAGNNLQIELCDAVPHKEIISLMTECSLFVLASRTEAMGRVLLEAMASKKPIIASNVDGIPTIIKDGFNGLLFEKENIEELAEKMKLILSDKILADKLAQEGFKYVLENLSAECYIEKYKSLIRKVLK